MQRPKSLKPIIKACYVQKADEYGMLAKELNTIFKSKTVQNTLLVIKRKNITGNSHLTSFYKRT